MREGMESPLLGIVEVATADERKLLDELADKCPVSVFQALNRALNKRGFLISIDGLVK